jgi:hypothetical protein
MPGVGSSSARCTVTVAASLLTGQVLLCLIVGWFTFGGSPEATTAASRNGDPASLPRSVVPSPSLSPTRAVPREPAVSDDRAARPGRTTGRPGGVTATATPGKAHPDATPTPRRTKTADGTPAGHPEPLPGAGKADDEARAVKGQACEEAGEKSRTKKGAAVQCERGPDGKLRWRAV